MPNTVLGKVMVTPKGTWSAGTAYEQLDIVAYGGASYLAVQNVPSGTALSNTSYWLCLAEKGDKGDTGEITGASASISGGYGTPGVSVTPGGTSTERTFAFAFTNLKGSDFTALNISKTSTSGNVDTYTWTATAESGSVGSGTFDVTNGSVTSVNGMTGDVEGLALHEDLLKAFPNDIAEGDIASFPDGAAMPVKSALVNVEPYQNLNGYDHPWAGGAGKNKLPLTVSTLKTINTNGTWSGNAYAHQNGITFTLNTDSGGNVTSISTTGTATNTCTFLLTTSATHNDLVGLNLNGCPIGGSGSTYFISGYNVTDSTSIGVTDVGSGATLPNTLTGKEFRLYIGMMTGVTGGKTFYPMAYNSADTSTFEPYTNICPIYPANGKNLLKNVGTSKVENGITWTVNDDMSISAKGTATANSLFVVNTFDFESDKSYVLTGCPADGDSSTKWQIQVLADLYSGATATDQGVGVTLSNLSGTYYIRCVVRSGNTVNFVFKPMIRSAEITDATYVPYRAFGSTKFGKNFFEVEERINNQTNANGSSATGYTLSDNSVTISKDVSNYGRIFLSAQPLPVGTYTLSFNTTASGSGRVAISARNMVSPRSDLLALTYKSVGSASVTFTVSKETNVAISIQPETSATGTLTITDIQIEVGSSATQYEPYTSERYFSQDVNLWDEEWEAGGIDNTTGNNSETSERIRSKGLIPVKPSTKYVIAYDADKYSNGRIALYGADESYLGQSTGWITVTGSPFAVTTTASTYYMRFVFVESDSTYSGGIQINYGDPKQVGYGGILDIETGLLTITHINNENLKSRTWTLNSASGGNVWLCNAITGVTKPADNHNRIMNKYKNGRTTRNNLVNGEFGTYNSTNGWNTICICDNNYSTVDSFVASLDDLQFVYELATYMQYQLTPTQVRTLLGYNNIWTDSGTVEINYLADPTLYIQKLTGSTEDDMIANANIASGKYFLVGNRLFLSTSAIAVGASIVPGTNCTETNLADALNALNA